MATEKTQESAARIAPSIDILGSPESPWIKTAEGRAMMTLACADGDNIPRVRNAGKTQKADGRDIQVMHNGLFVLKDGYQGTWQSKIIEGLKGIHEPQEEKVFYEVLKRLKPGTNMIELGSWWSYYSMWFLSAVDKSKAYCCEPDTENIALGRANARLNNFNENEDIYFFQYAAGSDDGKKISFDTLKGESVEVPIRSVDSIMSQEKIPRLDVLHMDIQGVELEALRGALLTVKQHKLRFLFVSTHHYSISEDPGMHDKCIEFITRNGGHIIAAHTVLESCSGDGLIVASFFPEDKNFVVAVTPQPTNDSLFRSTEKDLAILWNAHDSLYRRYQEFEESASAAAVAAQDEINKLSAYIGELTPLRKHLKRQIKQRIRRNVKKNKNTKF
ncbi:hypothetical protein BH10PAT3_BH10PAT3_1610 [soil metagenome]